MTAIALTQWMSSLLFGVEPTRPADLCRRSRVCWRWPPRWRATCRRAGRRRSIPLKRSPSSDMGLKSQMTRRIVCAACSPSRRLPRRRRLRTCAGASGLELTLIDGDGTKKVLGQLPPSVYAPRISPDGTRVAFERAISSGPRRTAALDRGPLEYRRPSAAHAGGGAINWAPMWTLDGEHLVFIVSGPRAMRSIGGSPTAPARRTPD